MKIYVVYIEQPTLKSFVASIFVIVVLTCTYLALVDAKVYVALDRLFDFRF